MEGLQCVGFVITTNRRHFKRNTVKTSTMSQYPAKNVIEPAFPMSEMLRNLPPNHHQIPKYFWGEGEDDTVKPQPLSCGYVEARRFAGDGSDERLERIFTKGLDIVKALFDTLGDMPQQASGTSDTSMFTTKTKPFGIVPIRLSSELQSWKLHEHSQGRILPGKGNGLRRVSQKVIEVLGAEHWPAPMLTSNVLFGANWANMLIGAHDARTLYSNCCCDMGFYYEHGFHKVFPEFEESISSAGRDPEALKSPHGARRRKFVQLGLQYIRGKDDTEAENVTRLPFKTARFDRHAANILFFCEASLAGMAVEAIGRGYDIATCYHDMLLSNPGTDVIDVGSDICNSEIMNSILNTADITDMGVVTEEALRRVYDAYAATGARCLTERWMEPLAAMNSMLYVWVILNDRHHFLRRIVLGYKMVRGTRQCGGQREADFDEAFDDSFHTTGFSRPLQTACDGKEPFCNKLTEVLDKIASKDDHIRGQLVNLWSSLVIAPMTYARNGIVDPVFEEELVQSLATNLAKCYHDGLILELRYILAHASHHAWQVNYLMEAAMFGSLLDDQSLSGTLDRAS
jgi:hypothetical protein